MQIKLREGADSIGTKMGKIQGTPFLTVWRGGHSRAKDQLMPVPPLRNSEALQRKRSLVPWCSCSLNINNLRCSRHAINFVY